MAGIIAGRVKERYYRPTIVLTQGKEGVKGSGRSIEEYNIFEELSKMQGYIAEVWWTSNGCRFIFRRG